VRPTPRYLGGALSIPGRSQRKSDNDECRTFKVAPTKRDHGLRRLTGALKLRRAEERLIP